jgi:hypothetical protein
VVVLVNPRTRAVRVTVIGATVDGARDLLSGDTHQGNRVLLPAYGVAVLRERGK